MVSLGYQMILRLSSIATLVFLQVCLFYTCSTSWSSFNGLLFVLVNVSWIEFPLHITARILAALHRIIYLYPSRSLCLVFSLS